MSEPASSVHEELSRRSQSRHRAGLSDLGMILIVGGMASTYFVAVFVERHYTAFWIGFWNLFALGAASVGFLVEPSRADKSVFLLTVFGVAAVLVTSLKYGASELVRMLGQGIVVTSATLALGVYFYLVRWDFAIIAAVANVILVYIARQRFMPS